MTDLHKRIRAIATDSSLETTPVGATKIDDFSALLPEGTRIAVTFLPGTDYMDTVETSKRLISEGMVPLPHVCARSIPSQEALNSYLGALSDVGVGGIIALGGGVDSPVGEFSSTIEMLNTNLFAKHSLAVLGVAGHPEGSPDIGTEDLALAIRQKNEWAKQTGETPNLVTQFAFEMKAFTDWETQLKAQGNTLAIRVGIPGPATLKTLINYARMCGIGASMRILTKQAAKVSQLLVTRDPSEMILHLARHLEETPNTLISGMHFYPLGGFKKASSYLGALRSGNFEIKDNSKLIVSLG